MGLGHWDHLSFKEIADKWSKEQAGKPNAFTSDEILQEFWSSMILGDFEDTTGSSRIEFLTVDDDANEGTRQPFGRQDLLGVLACAESANRIQTNCVVLPNGIEFPPEVLKQEHRLHACGTPLDATAKQKSDGKFRIPDPLPWDEAKEKVDWGKLAATPLSRCPENFRSAYLEAFRVSFITFAKWCVQRGLEQPLFWRGAITALPEEDVETAQNPYERWEIDQAERVKNGRASSRREAAKQIAAEESKSWQYVEREARRVRRERENSGRN